MLIGAFYLTGGSLGGTTQYLTENRPDAIGAPDLESSVSWLPLVVLVGIAAALYPHAIQRMYAARSERTLEKFFDPNGVDATRHSRRRINGGISESNCSPISSTTKPRPWSAGSRTRWVHLTRSSTSP